MVLELLGVGAFGAYLHRALKQDAEGEKLSAWAEEDSKDKLLEEVWQLSKHGKILRVFDSEGGELFRGKVVHVDFGRGAVVVALPLTPNNKGQQLLKVWSPKRGQSVLRWAD
jgi:hypothetical protein